ncbi:zinc metalloprotease HtpX [Candidatus Woesearchaeota archaeon]|nr:zinc metalloprotease HtpX [Candidatus Woesearchaeota archaeon]
MLKNQLKTVILLGLLTGLMLGIGQLLGGKVGLMIALIFAVMMNLVSYFFSDKLVLLMYRAQEVGKDHPLYTEVASLAHAAHLPMPRVYIIPTGTPNAFATGRNPHHAAVAATEGILRILDKDELRGVLAHELSHVKNRDILIATIAATIAGVISSIASMAQWAVIFGVGGRDEDNNGLANLVGLLFLAILTPIIATIIQLAISRSREYLADESGARLTKNPEALARALEKIERSVMHNPMPFGTEATSSLFIMNPFTTKGLFALFSTHPMTEERTKRLRAMGI